MRVPVELMAPGIVVLPSRKTALSHSQPVPRYIFGPHIDFWVLGGASIFLWVLLLLGDAFRDASPSIKERFAQVFVVFSFMSVFVNYPHFMISYRFGYGRGARFIFKNWIALLLVPLGMISFYALAYKCFAYDVSSNHVLLWLDHHLASLGIDLAIRERGALGSEILTASIWFMYFTVGWHYSKQIFGALMVYGKLKGYVFLNFERQAIKWNLFLVANYQFLFMNKLLMEVGSSTDPRFPGVVLTGFTLPPWVYFWATTLLVISTIGVLLIFGDLFFRRKNKPDLTFLACWASFLIWWIPVKSLPEFYLMAVPFFHSLQYLLFAAKIEDGELKKRSTAQAPRMIAVVVLTVLAGIAGFELVPVALDTYFVTSINQSAWFFMAAAAIFFNIHHFFIDSVVWKFNQEEVKRAFFVG